MVFRLNIGNDGRILIPKELRQKYNMQPGTTIVVIPEKDGIRLTTLQNSLSQARSLVSQYCKSDKLVNPEEE